MNPRSLAISGAALLAGTVAMTTLKPSPAAAPLGAVLPGITREMVCDHGYAGRVRHTTQAQKDEVLRLAGVPAIHRSLYEVDHVVPLSSGGMDDVSNLQAQLWDGPDGAHRKDLVENRAYLEVCAGRLTIEAAQAIFRTPGGWQAALKRYGLDKPKAKSGAQSRDIDDIEPNHDTEGFPR